MLVSAILEAVALAEAAREAVAVLEAVAAREVVAVLEADQVAVVLLTEVAIDLMIVTQVRLVL